MILVGIAMFGLGLGWPLSVQAQPASVDLGKAIGRAQSEQRMVLIEFFSYNSVESKIVADLLLKNPAIQSLVAEKYVVVRVEPEREPEFAAKYAVKKAPAVLVLSSSGEVFDRLDGLVRSPDLQRFLSDAVGGKSEIGKLKEAAVAKDAKPIQLLTLANALAQRGALVQATEEYRRAAELAMDDKTEARIVAQAVTRLAALLERQPEARQAMETTRDHIERQVRMGRTDLASLLVSVNSRLKTPERSVSFFLRLSPLSPARRQILPLVLADLVAAREYSAAVLTVDLEVLTSDLYAPVSGHHPAKGNPAHGTHANQASPELLREQRIADNVVVSVEALLGTGQRRKAERIAGRAIETLQQIELRGRLLDAAARSKAEDADAFKEWLAREYPPEKSAD